MEHLAAFVEKEAGRLAVDEAMAIGRAMGHLGGPASLASWQAWLRPAGLLRKGLQGPLALQVAAAAALGEIPGELASQALRTALAAAGSGSDAERWIGHVPRPAEAQLDGEGRVMSTVGTIQTRLEKALQRASQSDDRELAGRIRDEGHRLVFLLNGLLRSSRMYSTDNNALEAPSREFAGTLRGLLDLLGVIHVVCVEDQIYVNDVRLRVRQTAARPSSTTSSRPSAATTSAGISFHQPLDAGAMKAFAAAIAGPAAEFRPRAALATRLAALGDMQLSGKWRFRLTGDWAPTAHLDYAEVLRRAGEVVTEAVADIGVGTPAEPPAGATGGHGDG